MNSVTELKEAVVEALRADGRFEKVAVCAEYPASPRSFPLEKSTIAVGVDGVDAESGGLGGYWGVEQEVDLYGSGARITLRLDIYTAAKEGGAACHRLFESLCDKLILWENAFGVEKLWCEAVGYDQNADAHRLTARAVLRGALTRRDESLPIEEFIYKRSDDSGAQQR